MSLLPAANSCCDPCHDTSHVSTSIADLIEDALGARIGAATVLDFGAENTGVTDVTDELNTALADTTWNTLIFPPGTYRITDNLQLTRSNIKIIGWGATIIQYTAGKDGIGNYTSSVLRRVSIEGLQIHCAANVIGNAAFHLKNFSEGMLTCIKTSMQSNFNTDGFRYGIKFYGEAAIGNGCLYNEVNQPSILTYRDANSVGIDSDADTAGYGANSTVVLGGTIQALDGTGIRIDKCNNFLCLGVKCEAANLGSGYGIRIASPLGGNAIIGCRFEDLNVNIVLSVGANRNVITFNNHNSAATAVIQDFGTARSNTIIEPDIDGEKFNRIQLKDLDVFSADTSGLIDHTVFRGGVISTRYWDIVAMGFNAVTGGYDLEITNPTFKGDLRFTLTNGGLVRTDTLAPGTSSGAIVLQDGFVRFQRTAVGTGIWTGYTSGENNSRITVFNDGEHRFSDGTNADDVGLKRTAAGVLRITDSASSYGFVEDLYRRRGSGSPESVVTAPVGAVYHRTDGGAGTSFYVKESGAGNTGWIAK